MGTHMGPAGGRVAYLYQVGWGGGRYGNQVRCLAQMYVSNWPAILQQKLLMKEGTIT